uniref:DUF4097 domain-containing protein n=1 Tax=Eiseniibacteriota bacterium TaxID=2212470 RepID=A0A832I5J2_UNCEI
MHHGVMAGRPAQRRALGGTILFLLALALAALGFAADAMLTTMLATAAEAPRRETLAGDRVALYTLAGAVRVEAGRGQMVEVEVTPGGRDAASLAVETGRIGERTTLRVVFPGRRIVYPGIGRGSTTQLRVRDDGTFGDGRGSDLFGVRTVRIASSGGGLEAHADLRVYVPPGKTVEVRVGAGRIDAAHVDGRLVLDTASGPVTASGTRGDLVVETGSGGVRVSDARGDVTVDTGSGAVEVSAVRGDRLLVDTGSGSVRGSDLEVGSLTVDTGSGGIDLSEVNARDVSLDTGSGPVNLDLVGQAERVAVDTGSGDVTLRLPRSLGAKVSIETGSGAIRTDLPFRTLRRSKDALRGEIGDGHANLRLETGSGDVHVAAAAVPAR